MRDDAVRALKRAMLETYGFADKRIKNIDRGSLFIIDDRSPDDVGADRQLYSWFCQMFVEVTSGDRVLLTLSGDVPNSPRVAHWFGANAKATNFGTQVEIARGEHSKLADLAAAISAIVAPGARYHAPSYKYVCPRVAASLKKLQTVLGKFWTPSGAD